MAKKDPEGRRMARLRAAAAAEALEMLSVVRHRIGQVENDDLAQALENLCKDLRRKHREEAQRGKGHVEGRNKYRGRSPHLARESGRGVTTLYIDESGQAQPSPDQPVFVLAGIAMVESESADFITKSNALKGQFRLAPSVTLHGPKIEKCQEEFSFGGDTDKQMEFRLAVDELVEASSFVLLGAIIRKDVLACDLSSGGYGNLPPGLYEMALTFVAERFVDMLFADDTRPCGTLVFESIGNREDALHQRAFANLLIHGSEFVSDGCFRGWLRPGCHFRIKDGSHPLELADLAARAMHTWMRSGMPEDHPFWTLWAKRISGRGDLEHGKFGVKMFPDADIRDQVLTMRRQAKGVDDEA